jgi:hypothetical protein
MNLKNLFKKIIRLDSIEQLSKFGEIENGTL